MSGVYEKPVGATVEWFTPASLFDALLGPVFDLDPASADSPLHWTGHVWLNPPYGPAGVRFVNRMIDHGDGLLLLPSRTETRVYQRACDSADAIGLLRERLWFTRDDGFTGRSSFGSTLFAYGNWAAEILVNADLGVTFLWPRRINNRAAA